MNVTRFVGNQSVERYDINNTRRQELDAHMTTMQTLQRIIWYVAWVLGIPGNILSAIVWLRRHVTAKNSSAIYLAALAINDLAVLLVDLIDHLLCYHLSDHWYCYCFSYLIMSGLYLEPLLVLGFSAERLIAIVRPFQVCCTFIILSVYMRYANLLSRKASKNFDINHILSISITTILVFESLKFVTLNADKLFIVKYMSISTTFIKKI